MVLGLMVPPANGSPWRGSENQPVGLRPVTSARMLVASSMRAFSSARGSVVTSSCRSPCAATSWPAAMSPLMRAGSILAITAGTAKVALSPCSESAASNRSRPSPAANRAVALRTSFADMPSGPPAMLRSTTMWTAHRLPSGQRISLSSRLFSSEIV